MAKITAEELKQITDLKQEASQIIYALGELQYQRLALEIMEQDYKKQITDIKLKENQILTDLKTKYGNVNINIETGEIE